MASKFQRNALYIGLLTSLLFTACGKQEQKKGKDKSLPLVEVVVVKTAEQNVLATRTGTLRARREVKIFNQEEGQITAMPFFEGDLVEKGQVVARLNDELLKAQYNRAQAIRKKAAQDLKRSSNLHKKKMTSVEQLNASQTALQIAKADEDLLAARLRYTTITAPLSGVISRRLTEPGNIAERYTHLLTITDPSSLVTELSLSELLMAKLEKDKPVSVRIDALAAEFTGRISRIHPSLDPVSRRGTVEIELTPVPEGARPGQLCRVRLTVSSGNRVTVPFKALRRDETTEYVFTVDGNNKIKRINVVTGLRLGEQVEVIEGLRAGHRVVTKGFLNLVPGKSVAVVNRAANQAHAP